MKILAIEKDVEGTDWSGSTELLEQEARQVYQHFLEGFIREIYFTEHHNAVIILECKSRDAAVELLNGLPLVRKKMISFEVSELRPYDGYERIMKTKEGSF